jgi:hypothetical protein
MFIVIDTHLTTEKKFRVKIKNLGTGRIEEVVGFVKLFKSKLPAVKYIKRLPGCEVIEL